MLEHTTIVLIDQTKDSNIKEMLEKRPEFKVVASTSNVNIGFTQAEKHQPTLILLNIDLPAPDKFAVAEAFASEFPLTNLILITSSENNKTLRYALKIGAKDVIALPVKDDRLYHVIDRVIRQEKHRHQLFTAQKIAKPKFKTITVFSTKGGVGKTTIGLNLAIALRNITKKRVALVDLDLMAGNVALMAGVNWKTSIKNLVDELHNLDEEIINNYLTLHPSGLSILPAPTRPEYAEFILAEHVEKILSHMSQMFNYIIIDTPAYVHDTAIPALEQAQDIVIVTTLDLASIQNLKQSIELLTGLSMRNKIKVIVNKKGYSGGLKVNDLEDELGMEIHSVIPNCEKIAVDAVNLGYPIIVSGKNSHAARLLEELAIKFMVKDDYSQTKGKR